MSDMIEMVWSNLQQQLTDLKGQVVVAQQTERALFSDSVPAYTVANLPTLAQNAL